MVTHRYRKHESDTAALYKYKLQDLSRELHREHGWKMPQGFINGNEKDPRNYTLAQWQQAKRTGQNARTIKAALYDSWISSDNQTSLQQALTIRSFVVLDEFCEVYSLPKWAGLKTKDLRARIKEPEALPSVAEAGQQIAKDMIKHLETLKAKQHKAVAERQKQINQKRPYLIMQQTKERQALKQKQGLRRAQESKTRQARFNKGLHDLWDKVTGKHKKTYAAK